MPGELTDSALGSQIYRQHFEKSDERYARYAHAKQ
jgi:hypothetical protein